LRSLVLRQRYLALTAALVVGGAVHPTAAAPEVSWESVPDPLAGCLAGPDVAPTHLAVRVVDDLGGGVAGARLWSVGCGRHAQSGVLAEHEARVTDTRGWARLERSRFGRGDVVVSASGFAGAHAFGLAHGAQVTLPRGRDLVFEVRDGLDRPIPGALLGHRHYCGHTPDLRQARADEQGHGVLPFALNLADPSGWLWPLADGVASRDFDVKDWSDGRVVIRPEPGIVVEGRVLAADGTPKSGALVGATDFHRGPWTTTDAVGRFRLAGVQRGDELQVDPDDATYLGPDSVSVPVPPPGVPLVVRLGRAGPVNAPPVRNVVVRPLDPAGRPVPMAWLELWSPEVGWGDPHRTRSEGTADGELTVELPEGHYAYELDGWNGGFGTARGTLVVAGDLELNVHLKPLPAWRVIAPGLTEAHRVLLSTMERSRDVTDEVRAGVLRAPGDRPAVLRVFTRVHEPMTAAASALRLPARPSDSPIQVPVLQAQRLRVRTVTADGRPAACSLSWEFIGGEVASAGDVWIDGHVHGRDEVLLVAPGDPALAPARVPLSSVPGAPPRELPSVVLWPRRQRRLDVTWPPGSDRYGRELRVVEDAGPRDVDLDDALDGRAGLVTGATIVLRSPGHISFRVRLEGEGPWSVGWPSGSIAVAAVDGGEVVAFSALIDGSLLEGRRSAARLAGLAAGRHEVVVRANGRPSRRAWVDLSEGEALTLRVALPPAAR
jgi:hypothetical protein